MMQLVISTLSVRVVLREDLFADVVLGETVLQEEVRVSELAKLEGLDLEDELVTKFELFVEVNLGYRAVEVETVSV